MEVRIQSSFSNETTDSISFGSIPFPIHKRRLSLRHDWFVDRCHQYQKNHPHPIVLSVLGNISPPPPRRRPR